MPDVYTQQSSLSIDQTAYDRLAYFALRPELFYDRCADVRPTRQAMPGSAVVFTIISDLAVADTALTETVDPDAVAMSDSQVTLTLAEYGNAVITTAKLRGTSFIPVDPAVANVIGFNAGVSVDTVTRTVLEAGTNVRYAGNATSRTTVGTDDTLGAANVRRALAELRGANVATFDAGLYKSFIHPDSSYDLRAETGAAAWRDPHVYSQPGEIWNGSIGAFEGFDFIETPRGPLFADASDGAGLSGTIDVYGTLFLGRQALAKAHSITDGNGPFPQTVQGPVVDKLRRFVPMGWYWLGAYGRFREAALRRVESVSSIGDN
jgi:N4-gp56 family major capsid protein